MEGEAEGNSRNRKPLECLFQSSPDRTIRARSIKTNSKIPEPVSQGIQIGIPFETTFANTDVKGHAKKPTAETEIQIKYVEK